jgi:hypothetical protein
MTLFKIKCSNIIEIHKKYTIHRTLINFLITQTSCLRISLLNNDTIALQIMVRDIRIENIICKNDKYLHGPVPSDRTKSSSD